MNHCFSIDSVMQSQYNFSDAVWNVLILLSCDKLLALLILLNYFRCYVGTINMDIGMIALCPWIKWFILRQIQYIIHSLKYLVSRAQCSC